MHRRLKRPGDRRTRRHGAVAVEQPLGPVALPDVAADAEADGDRRGGRGSALDVDAAGSLIARRGRRRAQTAVGKVRLFDVGGRDVACVGAGQQVDARETRLDGHAHAALRRRHALLDRQRLAHAIAGDRREHLAVCLVADLAGHAPVRAARLPFHGGPQLAEVGVVGLQRRAVLAVLVEEIAAKACGKRRGRPDSRRRPAPRRSRRRPVCPRRRGRPRRPGCSRRSWRPRRPPMPSSRREVPPPNSDNRPESCVAAAPSARSVGAVGRRVTTCTTPTSASAPYRSLAPPRTTSTRSIGRGRHTVPVHPATERVVEHLAVGQHQRTAGAARPTGPADPRPASSGSRCATSSGGRG